MRSRRRFLASELTLAMMCVAVSAVLPAASAKAGVPPQGFQEQIVFSGLNRPTNIEFSPDGRIFVAEQQGLVKVFDGPSDTTPTIFADLRDETFSAADSGLLGLALPPDFPTNPWVYVAYTYDAPPGGTAPTYNDDCGNLAITGNCVVTSRVSRLQASGNTMVGTEDVLLTNWCQQFSIHSIGDLKFGPDGALYVTGGEGATSNAVDYGQLGSPANPCGDPDNEGGALRSQDVLTVADPTGLNGSLLRVDPETGQAMGGNPNLSSPDLNTRRIVAHGLRNPFRMAFRPGTNEVWVGDVGWATWEEIDRVVNPVAGVANFGWPCYEGAPGQSQYDNAKIPLCKSMYAGPPPTPPYFSWNHANTVVPGEVCPTGGSAVSGLAFYPNSGLYPQQYRGALFFADYARQCIWAMKPSSLSGGMPSPSNVETFVEIAAHPVDLEIGPGGELYYVDLGGTIRRLRYYAGNQPPVAYIAASPTAGELPLAVTFDGTGSTDADPADVGRLTYAWDFTNDGTTDSTAPNPTFIYTTQGVYSAKLTVTDTLGAQASTTIAILAGLGGPTAFIDTPVAGATWGTGQTIAFSGHATDPQDGVLSPSQLSWELILKHCAVTLVNCHEHQLQTWTGASGSFVAPDHEYPSYLELRLTATDADGVTHTVPRRLDPRTSPVTFATSTPGLTLSVGSFTGETPFTMNMIQGSTTTVSAPSPQVLKSNLHTLTGWSDGGAATHVITVPTSPATLAAAYAMAPGQNLALNKPATANTECNPDEAAPKAVNGSVDLGFHDKWCGVPGPADKWLMVDLGAPRDISAFVVRHAGAGGEDPGSNTRDFTIETSADATNWTTAATVTGNTANVTTHFVTVTARYVRLRITTPTTNGNDYARIYEFEVIGLTTTPQPPPMLVNLALSKTATANTTCNANEAAPKAVNGSVNGGFSDKWCGAPIAGDKSLMVDLGTPRDISAFVVRHAGAGGEDPALNTRDFTIETSTDATNWTTAATVTGNTANVTTHLVTVTARYARLRITTPTTNGNNYARIYEFEIMGTVTTPQPPPPTQVNLALNKTATANTTCNANEAAPKAVNGSVNGGFSDKWCGAPIAGDKSLMVDLGTTRDITTFVIRHAGAGGEDPALNTRDFTIETSTDAITWTTAVTTTANTANVTTHPVTVTARYARLRITTPTSTGDNYSRIYEFEIMGTVTTPQPPPPTQVNLALNKTATANTTCNANEAAPKAVNGSVNGGFSDKWCGAPIAGDKSLMVDLGTTRDITTFVIRHAGAGGEDPALNTRDFTIETSTDAITWTTAVTTTANTANVTTHPVTVTARYARLRITTPTSTGDNYSRIYEFEIMGP